ncbi:MAG: hypothetical protein M1836_003315 [Candelina mexicana]|nr:MAG: hypothetical protein M1836_003315 [Candelina mexicana]
MKFLFSTALFLGAAIAIPFVSQERRSPSEIHANIVLNLNSDTAASRPGPHIKHAKEQQSLSKTGTNGFAILDESSANFLEL